MKASCDDSNSNANESDSDIVLRIDTSTSEDSLDENTFFDKYGHCDTGIDQHFYSFQECQDLNATKINSKSVVLRRKSPNITATNSPEQSNFECDTCGKYFSKKIGIIRHVRVHVKVIQQSFECKKCDESYSTKISGRNSEKCPFCYVDDNFHSDKNEKKLTIDQLKGKRNIKHAQSGDHSENSQNVISGIRCFICNKHYSTRSNLTTHMRTVHRGEKPYECTECGKRFAQKGSLKRHTVVHGSEKPFKCSFCNVGFTQSSSKRSHEQRLHEGSAHFQCAHCEKRFGRRANLISHIHSKHISAFQKQFKCTICDKSFVLKNQLQQHKFVHSSQRSFKCSVCDRGFKHPQAKTRHEKAVHGKGVRFPCKHCDKGYGHKTYLIRHLQKYHVK